MKNKSGFNYDSYRPGYAQKYLEPTIRELLSGGKRKILDVGCGNGVFALCLKEQGHEVWGCDWDKNGVELANIKQPGRFIQWDLNRTAESFPFSEFDVVVSTEVIEHLFFPRKLFELAHHVLKKEGLLIISTPYHGYLKNLMLCLMGKWDWHHNVEHDGGHIKFFSPKTLGKIMTEEGFIVNGWKGCGRTLYIWKSMVMWGVKTPTNRDK